MVRHIISFICAVSCFFMASAHATPQEIVQLADYISVDYPDAIKDGVIINEAEYKEMEEFSQRISYLGAELRLDPTVLKNMEALDSLIKDKAEPSAVASKARDISLAISQQYNLIIPPKSPPDPVAAAALYQQNCASCHGASGKGDGPLSGQLEPQSTNFQDFNRAALRSINGLYNTITMGVADTGMAAYEQQLTDDQRWSLAFYVSQLFATEEQLARGEQEWQQLANKAEFTPERIISRTLTEETASPNLITYLRHNPEVLWANENNAWLVTQQLLDASFKTLKAGDPKKAYQLALNAYLEGFELLEPVIDTFDTKERQELEMIMIEYRQAVQENDVAAAEKILSNLQTRLQQTEALVTGQESNFFAVFLSALIILLREGLEIILVLAVMFVLVKRTNQKTALPYIHAGWISAIFVGLGLWYLSHQVISISGGEREFTEGILSLLAAAILFYVGFWIHRQSSVQQWQKTLQGQLNKQMAKRSLLGLSFIAFIAVFREMLEIALFYETLWLQTQEQQTSAILSGIIVAIVVLLILSVAINKLSIRLQINKFFLASSILIIVLSVIFLGSGLQALAEAGKFPISLINIPQVDLLGIYPNLWILLSQLGMVVIAGYVWFRQKKGVGI